ncbi:MAG: DUF2165 domain-containing protein [Gammaproteobacteria bacterium]
MAIRLSKTFLVASVAFFALLVASNNIFDYSSNFEFVRHVLMMDTTFPGNALMWRAINAPWVHHIGYWMIIVTEFLTAGLCALGAIAMFSSRQADDAVFQASKSLATLGLVTGIALWFVGFICVGGEWFLMWQSESWNGQQAAFRSVVILFAVLIFLHQPETREA